jgi:hypothetical protein
MRTLLVMLLCSATAAAQVALEGDVVRKSTGEPLAGVRVLTPCPQSPWTATDQSGHFHCIIAPDLRAPFYNLALDGPGLLPRRQSVSVNPGDNTVQVRVAMTQQAAISGTVVDENGWPVRASVTAAQFIEQNGERRLEPVRRVQTDDLGGYRLGKLPPGRYYLRIRPQGGAPWSDYLPVWYPAAADPASAKAIVLREGQEASGTVIRVSREGGVEVSGRVAVPAGFQPADAHVRIAWEDLGSTVIPGESVPVRADGTFTLHHITPGKYRLTATTSDFPDESAPPKYSAFRTIEVSGEKLDGVVLDLAPTVLHDLKGTVACEGTVKPEQVQITLQRSPGSTALQLKAKVDADGSFAIPGVWPGTYRGNAWAPGATATSIRFGSREVARRDIDFDGTEALLHVTIRGEDATVPVAGTVTDANNRPLSGATVILLPSGGAYVPQPYGNITPADTDQNGAFTARPAPPGVYRVYVVEDPTEIDSTMADRDFRTAQEQAFPPIMLTAGETPRLKLALPAHAVK